MYKIKQEEKNRLLFNEKGPVKVYEYQKDMSAWPTLAVQSYFASEMNIRKRQAYITLNGSEFIVQSGSMQWMAGNVNVATNIKGGGDFLKKLASSKVTGESAIKPKYSGSGTLVLEPTYKHLLLMDVSEWGSGMVIDDNLFLGCEGTVDIKTVSRTNLSSAFLGGEGLFNSSLSGRGIVILESPIPEEELIEVELVNDVLKIDGNYAIAWSRDLTFTVERTTKTLIGSAASGEGLVNVYKGTGKVLLAVVTDEAVSTVPTGK